MSKFCGHINKIKFSIPWSKIQSDRKGIFLNNCGSFKKACIFQEYLDTSESLPYLNNEVTTSSSPRYKRNFENLERMVLIGGPDDDVIMPWQSAHYGFYNSDLDVVLMKDQQVYKENLFGLKTLDDAGKITMCTYSNVYHTDWIRNYTVYENCIKPYL